MELWQKNFVQYLQEQFENSKKRNPRYSLRSFAKKLEISAGTLSEIFSGKRKLKLSKVELILRKCVATEKSYQQARAQLGLPIQLSRKKFQAEESNFLFDWISHVTLGFFEIDNPQINAQWISRKIGIPKGEIQKRIDEFVRNGQLEKNGQGRVQVPDRGQQWQLSENIDLETQRRFREEQIRLAQHAIQKGRSDDSYFSSATFLGTKQQLAMFKDEILLLYDRLVASADVSKNSELIRISVQAFPIDFKK